VPLRPHHTLCWIVTVEDCAGDVHDFHADALELWLPGIARVWAAFPEREPLVPWQHDTRCLLVVCRGCGLAVGDGEHFADAEHAWRAADEDGWQADVCPFCQPSSVPPC
jgi:hypothetical protein